MPIDNALDTQGFVVSIDFFANSDSEAAEVAWNCFQNSEAYKIKIYPYLSSIINVEITELSCIETYEDTGTVVGQVVFFGE